MLVLVAIVSYNKISQYNKSVYWVMHTNFVKSKIIEVVSNLKDAENGQRAYLYTDDSVFLKPHMGEEHRNNIAFVRLDSLISNNPNQKENLKKLKTLVDERYFILKTNLELFKNTPPNLFRTSALLEGRIKMDEVNKQVELITKEEDSLLVEHIEVKDRTANITPVFLLVLSLFSIFVIALFFFLLQKETSARISITEANRLLEAAKKQV